MLFYSSNMYLKHLHFFAMSFFLLTRYLFYEFKKKVNLFLPFLFLPREHKRFGNVF